MVRPLWGSEGALSKRSLENEFLLVCILLAITLLTYLSSLTFEFVYDDQLQIARNPFVQSWRFVPRYFKTHVWGHLYPTDTANYYRPFFLLWLLLNYSLFGLSPMGWHASTILLHLAATALTYKVVWKLTQDRLTAAMATLLFGVHPVHVEVVAWISGVTESLYTIPFLASFLAYLKSREGNSRKWIVLSLALYATALLCKETAIVLPVLVLAHTWIYATAKETSVAARLRAKLRDAVWVATAYLPVAAAYLGVRAVVLKGLSHASVSLPIPTLALTLPSLLCFYLRLLVFPVRLSAFYDLAYVDHMDVAHVLLPALLLLLVATALWRWQRHSGSPEVKFAIVWLLILLLPVLNLSALGQVEFAHDRYLYLPSFGFSLLIAIALQKLASGRVQRYGGRSWSVVFTLIISALLCLGTAYYSAFWMNDFVLYSHAFRIAPRNPVVMYSLGAEFMKRGRFQEAKALHEKALYERPDLSLSHYGMAILAFQTGKLVEAERFLVQAIAIDPSSSPLYVVLGATRLKMGRLADATADLRHAIALNPGAVGLHSALGLVLERSGDCSGAGAQFRMELAINPGDTVARRHLAKCSASR